jgi:Ca2+-binding RTX toxin-like protein
MSRTWRTFTVALAVTLVAGTGVAPHAAAAPSCSYDGGTKTVSATLGAGESATLAVTGSGQITFGAPPSPCGATTTNTDKVVVSGPAGSTEHLVIDQSAGALAPGATAEGSGISEIEVTVALGDAADDIVVKGSPTQQPLAVGNKGVAFDGDGDVDIVFAPLPKSIELVAADGMPHVLSARGGFGSGRVFAGPVTLRGGNQADTITGSDFADLLVGNNGADFIHGSAGADIISGGGGNDKLRGAEGDDTLSGGPGVDIFSGSYGNDVLDAWDGVADAQLNGGPGVDSAVYDRGLDPAPVAVENLSPRDPSGPPPPNPNPVTECNFGGGVATATIAPGKQATLKVSGGQILFGAPAVACGGATTSNTDQIVVAGATGTKETLVIDLRGGLLAPGATAEGAGASEIETNVNLHDATDVVRAIARGPGGFLVAGGGGIAFNHDGDVDVTIAPKPILISLRGGSGADRLSAAGGHGTGGPFAGVAELRGGGGRDILLGGRGNDQMWGGAGVDRLRGGLGRDRLRGDRGADYLWGGRGKDILRAVDSTADRRVDGGSGRDTVYYDRGRDHPLHCEVFRPRSG